MTREEAIEIRQRQLQGESVDLVLCEEAVAVLAVPSPRIPGKRGPKPGANYHRTAPVGLLAAKARMNRVLLKNLQAIRQNKP